MSRVFYFTKITGVLMLGMAALGCMQAPSVIADSEVSESDENGNVQASEEAESQGTKENTMTQDAVFAGGCFWCVEGVFLELAGVEAAISGYAGGTADTANYRDVSSGRTKHAEAVRIVYDPEQLSYEQLLEVFFATHDPTQLNRQGPDVGPQYRSAIFYADARQKAAATEMIRRLEAEDVFDNPIVTTLEPLDAFYEAEAYHQDYVACNPMQPYIVQQALPKIKKVREKFGDLVRSE